MSAKASSQRFVPPLIKGGIFVVITVLATAILGISISNAGLRETTTYTARFIRISQLAEGDGVRMAGVRVGQVEDVRIVNHDTAEVTFSVEKGYSLPSDVTATIQYKNLIGGRYIELGRLGEPDAHTLPPGSMIPAEQTTPALDLTALFNGFQPLFRGLAPKQINKLSAEIIQVLQGEAGTVESLLHHIASLTSTLAEKDRVIGQVIENLNSVLATINSTGNQLERLITTLQGFTSSFAESRRAIGEAIEGLGAMTKATAELLGGIRPSLESSIESLGELSSTLVDSRKTLERFLTLLPKKFTEIGRMASYGSWMNFFLCEAVLTSAPPHKVDVPAGRCNQ